ncbi:MAG: SDR family oxidoreductase [Burkholderiales bacterium]|nr:SDR family oxidoreductase [Burkholderiales bacterium]
MNLFVFGYGYSSATLVRAHRDRFAQVHATVRGAAKAQSLAADGVTGRIFDGTVAEDAIVADLAASDALLVSVPPDAAGDPVLRRFADAIAASPRLAWIGYLSTVGVYGDHGGGWVDEATPPNPTSERSVRRLEAEEGWLALGRSSGKAVHVFRLAGIYGPGQNALVNLRDGTARRIVKPGQVFNRIHVEDIAGAVMASLARPAAGAVYNVTDDEPSPPQDVVAFAAGLMGVPVPPDLPFESATLSPMARSFYSENKRVSNRRLKEQLGYAMRYPTYREALRALFMAGDGAG